MTEYTVAIHNPFASLLGMDDVPSESQPSRMEISKTNAEKKPQAKKPQPNQSQQQGSVQPSQQGTRTNQRQGQQGPQVPNIRQQGSQASSQQGGARAQGFPGQGARVNRGDQQQRNQQGQQQRPQSQQGSNQQRSGDQQGQGQKRKINYVPVVPSMTIEQRRPRFDRDSQGPREDRGNNEVKDFRGDENLNRGNRGERESFNYRSERPFGRPRREGGPGGQAGGRFAMDRHSRGGAGTGIKDNTKRRGGGAHQWGAEGSELEDIDLEQDSPSTPVEPLVKEGLPSQEEAATNSESEATEAEKKETGSSESEKKESSAAEGGEGAASDKKKKKKKKKKGDKEGDKKGKVGGEDSGEDSDPNALKDEEMVLYEDFLKEKQDKAAIILPKLPEARKGGEGVEADAEWNKGVLWERDEEELAAGGKTDAKKKQAGSKKEKKGPLTPELPIVFEMRDTRREDRGFGRGSRRREGAAGEAGSPQRERYGDRQRGGQFGGGRGSRGPRKFGGRRAPNFDERSFPSLSPTSGNEAEGQANTTQQSS